MSVIDIVRNRGFETPAREGYYLRLQLGRAIIQGQFAKMKQTCRSPHIPLPDGPGQVKLPVGQVDFSKIFFYIEEIHNFGSQANKNCWIPWALTWDLVIISQVQRKGDLIHHKYPIP